MIKTYMSYNGNKISVELTDNENLLIHKSNIANSIINTLNIDRSKLIIEDVEKPNKYVNYILKYVYISFVKDGEKYPICNFTEYEDRIVIYFDKDLNKRKLFSIKINKKSGKVIANSIIKKTDVNKEIYIFKKKTDVTAKLIYLIK